MSLLETISGFNVATRMMQYLLNELQAQGGDGRDLRKLEFLPEVRAQIAELLIKSDVPGVAPQTFTVVVDYTQSVADMIAKGKYDWVNSDITQEHFPVHGLGASLERKLELVHFDRMVSTAEAEAELDRRGLKPAEIEDLLAFGASNPELQRQFPIVALGSRWQDSRGYWFVPMLYEFGDDRNLGLRWIEDAWFDRFRFLALRK